MTKQTFLKGAIILVTASFYNRLLGFIYKILVIRLIGTEGIGLYEMVFPFYILVLVITTAGVPLAISKLVAEEMAKDNLSGAYRIFRIALSFLTVAGATVTLILYKTLPFIIDHFYSDPRVYWSFWVMIPAIFIISVCSAFRGFFQGLQQMTPTAVSQVVEQTIRFFVGLWFANYFLPYGVEFAAMGMAIGMAAGEFIGLLLMIGIFLFKRPRLQPHERSRTRSLRALSVIKGIFYLAFPITLTRIVYSTSMTIQASLVPQRLQATGLSIREATEMFGQYSGIAVTLLHLPTMVTVSLAITLVPAISEAITAGNSHQIMQRINQALRITLILGLPSVVIFLLFPYRLSELLFATSSAGVPLKVLAWGALFLYLQQTTTGILQGLGKVGTSLFNAACGAAITLTGIYYLTALPDLGIRGTAIAANMGFFIVATLNLLTIWQTVGFRINFIKTFLTPAGAALIMAFTAYYMDNYLQTYNPWLILPILGFSGGLYLLILVLTKSISINQFQRFIK
ncbi:stage V sporulation protein B [Metallumcola ferriviriculae]|uniref:Stage V sporulation protein B n=1 Tax=Metallumcola ferriviriculae TaxID=3039180 RepID=A0AAU0UPA8_9FIRM|nr:stage V sporulation protein B [Desulfitibacteraceae bacterium MK1]